MVLPLTGLPPAPLWSTKALEKLTSGLEKLLGAILAAQQGRDVLNLVSFDGGLDLLDGAGHGRVRPNLDEQVDIGEFFGRQDRLDGLVEQHWAAKVGAPVGLVHDGVIAKDGVGNRRNHFGGGQKGQGALDMLFGGSDETLVPLGNRSHVVRVIGLAVGLDGTGKDAISIKLGLDDVKSVSIAGQGDKGGRVVAGNDDLALDVGEVFLNGLGAKANGHHGTASVDPLSDLSTVVGSNDGLVGRDEAGGVRSGDLTRRVANGDLWDDAPGSEQLDGGNLDGGAERLGELGLVDGGALRMLQKNILNRPLGAVREILEDEIKGADGSEESGAVSHQISTHAGPLSALAGEDEANGANALLVGKDEVLANVVENTCQRVVARNCETLACKHAAAVAQGVRKIKQVIPGSNLAVGIDVAAQRSLVMGRERQQEGPVALQSTAATSKLVLLSPAVDVGIRRGVASQRVSALDDNVGVGAAVAEAVDGNTTDREVAREGDGVGRDPDLPLIPFDGGTGVGNAASRGDDATLDNHDGLDEGRKAAGGFRVANVRFDCPDPEGLLAGLAVLVHGHGDGVDLERVANGGAGAVALKVAGQAGVEIAAALVSGGNDIGLAISVGVSDASGGDLAVGVGGAGPDNATDRVAVPDGVGKALQVDGADGIGTAVPIGTGIEGVASRRGRQDTELGSVHVLVDGDDQVDTANDGALGLVVAQSVAGVVQGVNRRRAGGVAHDAGAVEVEDVADTVADDAGVDAGGSQAVTERVLLESHLLPVGGEAGSEDGSPSAGDLVERDAARLEGLIDHLEQLALLRIHPHGLDRGDAEQAGIKLGKVALEKISTKNAEAARPVVVLVDVRIDVEARRGDLGRVASALAHHEVPEFGGRLDIAGQTAAWEMLANMKI
ncbi:hypothetical protein Trco_007404 [Trichoderma cornu-damae]|uniref:Uncharacterized protein n=1 Tax=Trichoderma cornu-damae TaxID=654480 RepID=A0A9P8QJP8_9HYPO|nr:hypothetical protein Trco_007404 [Trichoderma cornu-damae]